MVGSAVMVVLDDANVASTGSNCECSSLTWVRHVIVVTIAYCAVCGTTSAQRVRHAHPKHTSDPPPLTVDQHCLRWWAVRLRNSIRPTQSEAQDHR